MKVFWIMIFPLLVCASEKNFMKMASELCGKIRNEKERQACVTGSFIDFCQHKKNIIFCNKEANRADYTKRVAGAKSVLKRVYKNIKAGKLNLNQVFLKDNTESYYFIFGVPEKCKEQLAEDAPANSALLHGLFERAKRAEKNLIKRLNKFKCPKKGELIVYAVGQLDDDRALDIWYVNNKKRIKHLRSDLIR